MLTILSNCDKGATGNEIADIVELLCPYDLIELSFINEDTFFWCWPLKWLYDVVSQFVFFEERNLLVKGHLYDKLYEFGPSVLSGILKVFSHFTHSFSLILFHSFFFIFTNYFYLSTTFILHPHIFFFNIILFFL
jgi:hypothetical protein